MLFSQPNPHSHSWNPPTHSWKNQSNQMATFPKSNLNLKNPPIIHDQNFPNLHASQNLLHIQNPHIMPNSHSLLNFQNHQVPQQSSFQNPPILQNVPLGSHPYMDPSIQTLKEQLASQQQALAQMIVSARSFNANRYFELLFSMICFFHGSRLVKLLNVINPLISCY